jgi:putative transposase
MSLFLRHRLAGGTYSFTVVTHQRQRILTSASARRSLREAITHVRCNRPFRIVAVVLLPDHLHMIWELPRGDADYSTRWRRIKSVFSRTYLSQGGREGPTSASRRRKAERGIWQRRFYEHTCRDESDLKRCADYVHWNPVKHGLVPRVGDYPWSSFHRYVGLGEYAADWGGTNPLPGVELGE